MHDLNLTPDSDPKDGSDLDLPLGGDTDDIADRIDLTMDKEPTPPPPKPKAEPPPPTAPPKEPEPLVDLKPAAPSDAPSAKPAKPAPAAVKAATAPPRPVAPAKPALPAPKSAPKPAPAADEPPPLPTDGTPIITSDTPTPGLPVAKRITPVWQVLEPTDPSDPVEHEACEAKGARPGWRVVAGSVRGKLHAHKAQWREDSYQWGTADGWTILAASDGAGSSRLSRVASRLACETSVAHLQKLLAGYTLAASEGSQPSDGDLHRLRTFLTEAAEQAWRAVLKESKDRSTPAKEFYCTLLLAVHGTWMGRDVVAALQIGDGVIGLLSADGAKTLGTADHGEYSSETRFLTTPGMEHEFQNRVLFSLPTRLTALLLATDGVSDDFYPEDKRIGELFTSDRVEGLTARGGEPLQGVMRGVAKNPDGGEALRDWLRYEKRGSSDDRTLLMLYRSEA